MIKLLYGNEPFLIKERIAKACEEISMPEMNIKKTDNFGEDELILSRQYPFIDKKRIILLSLEALTENELLREYINDPSETTDLYITAEKMDKRSSIFRLLKKYDMTEEINKISPDRLKKFIFGELEQNNASIEHDAYELLAERLNYLDDSVNLYNVQVIIHQLCFASKAITKKDVLYMVEETVTEKAFSIFSMIVSGKGDKAYRVTLHLLESGEQAIGLLSLILRNYRLLYKYHMLTGSMQEKASAMGLKAFQIKFCANTHITLHQTEKSMQEIEAALNNIKKGGNPIVISKLTIGKLLHIAAV